MLTNDAALNAFILSCIAGMATMLGAGVIFFAKGKSARLLSCSLGFAAGVMLSVSFIDLFPTAQQMFKTVCSDKASVILSVAFFILGLLTAAGLDAFVPHEAFDTQKGEHPHKNLFRVGFVSMAAIALHNFPEGMATFMAGYKDFSLGVSITIAISMHNIPEGIAVAMPIFFATNSRKKALKFTFLSAIAEPVGALLAFTVLRPFIGDFVLAAVFCVVAGIMIYIAVEELIPSSRQYGHDRDALIFTFAGICLMPLTHLF